MMLADSGERSSQSPEPRSESGDELFTPGGLCNQGVLQYMVHRWSERQVVTQKQVGTEFPPTPYRPWSPCRA
jgi:hypothetical protein